MLNGQANVPEGFQWPQLGEVVNGVARTFIGASQGQTFTFTQIKDVNVKKTEATGVEMYDDVDLALFPKDKSQCTALRLAVNGELDMNTIREKPYLLAPYKQWKSGQKSGLTDVRNWAAISEPEMIALLQNGFLTVEQILQVSDEQLMILGMGWKDIKIKAEQHMKGKEDRVDLETVAKRIVLVQEEAEKSKAERDSLREELERVRQELNEKLYAAAPKKRTRSPRKKPGVQEEAAEAA